MSTIRAARPSGASGRGGPQRGAESARRASQGRRRGSPSPAPARTLAARAPGRSRSARPRCRAQPDRDQRPEERQRRQQRPAPAAQPQQHGRHAGRRERDAQRLRCVEHHGVQVEVHAGRERRRLADATCRGLRLPDKADMRASNRLSVPPRAGGGAGARARARLAVVPAGRVRARRVRVRWRRGLPPRLRRGAADHRPDVADRRPAADRRAARQRTSRAPTAARRARAAG